MRTTVDLPADLVARALELSSVRTKREVLTMALEEYVKRRLRERLRDMRGTDFLDMTHEELQRMRVDE